MVISFPILGKFSAIMSIFSWPFFLSSSSGTPMIRILGHFTLSQRSRRLSSFLLILFSFFLSASFLLHLFLPFYLFFSLLHFCFIYFYHFIFSPLSRSLHSNSRNMPKLKFQIRISDIQVIKDLGKVKVLVAQLCPTLCDPMVCSPLGSSDHGILQARISDCSSHYLLQGIFQIQRLPRERIKG